MNEMKSEKVDVSRRVYGKVDDSGSLIFYLKNDKIGELLFTETGREYRLSNGFEFEEERIYNYVPISEGTNQYVEECDLG